jgi:hypothetical protein
MSVVQTRFFDEDGTIVRALFIAPILSYLSGFLTGANYTVTDNPNIWRIPNNKSNEEIDNDIVVVADYFRAQGYSLIDVYEKLDFVPQLTIGDRIILAGSTKRASMMVREIFSTGDGVQWRAIAVGCTTSKPYHLIFAGGRWRINNPDHWDCVLAVTKC